MFQIRVVCSLIAVILITYSQATGYDMLISPCPKVFKYEIQVENHQPLAKRWYGVVNLATNVTYHALWLNIILDRKADILGSWIGEVTTKDNIDFMIENLNITIQPEQKRSACFFVQYSSDFQPKVKAIFVNGREVCHAYNYTHATVDRPISGLNNYGGSNKSRIKSIEKTVAVPIIENIHNKAHHSKKIIRTTTSKPRYHIQTTTKRTQTTTKRTQTTIGKIKHINPVHVTPKSKTKLFFLKKSKNNQHTSAVIVGNSTCFSCKSNVSNQSIKIDNIVKGPTTTIPQGDNKDKNLQLNIQTFNNLHTEKSANLTTAVLTSRKIKGVYRSKTDNNRTSDSLKTSTNAYATTDASTTRKISDDRLKIGNSQRFESLQTAQSTFVTTYISTTTQIKDNNRPTTDGNQKIANLHTKDNVNLTTVISTTTKINRDDNLKINNNQRFNDFHTTGNANVTTVILTTTKINGDDKLNINNNRKFNELHTTNNTNITTEIANTMKTNGDNRLKIDNNQRFDNLYTVSYENLTAQKTKIKDDHRPKTNNNQRVDNLYTTGNANLTVQTKTTMKIKGDDRPNIEDNVRFDNLQTAQNAYTTEIATTRKIKENHILKIPNNRKFNSLQTTPTPFTTVSISTTKKIKTDDRSNTGNNHGFDSLQKGPNVFTTTNISTTRKIKGDDRRNRRTNNDSGFSNLQTATNQYIMIQTSNSKKTKGGGGSNLDDFEAENNEDRLDTLGVIGLPETSGRPEIDTTSGIIPSPHRQSDIRDIFKEPTLDEEQEIHTSGDRAVIPPNFDSEPSCGKVLKTRQLHLPYGSSTSEGQWPWQVAIYQQRTVDLKYICGGTLVSHRHVITAAHCVTRKRSMGLVHTKTITVYLGKFNLRLSVEGVQVRFVKGIRVHPEYNSTTFSHDLAILELRSSADITDLVRPVCLWPEDEIGLNNVIGQTGSVVGWSFEESSLANAELHLTEMPVLDHETCISAFENFYETLLSDYTYCAGYKQGTDTCNSNDSGGGMVFKKSKSWYLRGIVSVSISLENEHRCDSKHFIVFTDIAKFLPWIRDYID